MSIRQKLEALHRDDLNAFILEKFPEISRELSELMNNRAKINELIKCYIGREHEIEEALRQWQARNPLGTRRASLALVVVSSQDELKDKQTTEGAEAIQEAITKSKNGRTIEVKQNKAETSADIEKMIADIPRQALHIHGKLLDKLKKDLEDLADENQPKDQQGQTPIQPQGGLSDEKKLLPLRLLTLSSPGSGELANKMVGTLADCTVGVDGGMSEEAEQVFFSSFYKSLGDGCHVHRAFDRAKTALGVHDRSQYDRPQLFEEPGGIAQKTYLPRKQWSFYAGPGWRLPIFLAYLGALYLLTLWVLKAWAL